MRRIEPSPSPAKKARTAHFRSSLVFNWINGTWPHPDHVFVKGAVPATGSAYFALCGDQHMPQKACLSTYGAFAPRPLFTPPLPSRHALRSCLSQVDLALLEHGTNDVGISLRKTNLELYVRRVLTRSRRAKVAVGFAGAAGDAMGTFLIARRLALRRSLNSVALWGCEPNVGDRFARTDSLSCLPLPLARAVEDIERHTRAQAAHGNSVCGIPVDEAHSHSADGGVGAGGVGGNGAGGAAGNHTGANAIMDETAAVLVDWWVDRPWNFDGTRRELSGMPACILRPRNPRACLALSPKSASPRKPQIPTLRRSTTLSLRSTTTRLRCTTP